MIRYLDAEIRPNQGAGPRRDDTHVPQLGCEGA